MDTHTLLEGKKLNYQSHKNGSTYVYEVLERYWDKEKKQARTKQVYLGKLDPETGAFVPSKRFGEDKLAAMDSAVTVKTHVSGPAMLLNQIEKELGLSSTLRKAAPEIWKEMLALAWYVLLTGRPLSDADVWLENHESPTDRVLSSQRISELLALITEDVRQTFFKLWGRKLAEGDHLCYDITSVSSYAKQNEYVRYGYNRDREALPQINLAMVYGQKSFLPVTCRELPGSITDVKTLANLLHQFQKLDFARLHVVMDKGFYSQQNIDELCAHRHHFSIAVPSHLRFVRDYIDAYRDEIDCPDGLRMLDGEAIYLKTFLHPWGEFCRRCYQHVYFNPQHMTDDRVAFDLHILQLERELLEEQLVESHQEQYRQFFHVRETAKQG
ncbi:MAG: transposase, partial [Bacillota bacterium]|nr:transposase [Bacillota bacterium]